MVTGRAQNTELPEQEKAQSGEAYVFINYKQALSFGHIAWGFSLNGTGMYCYGSTDHLWRHSWWDVSAYLRYMDVPPNGDLDWWSAVGTFEEMMETMKAGHHIRYHHYKKILVSTARPEEAVAVASALKTGGWSVGTNNCVHHTYKVISAYGAKDLLANPHQSILNRVPFIWFNAIPGDCGVLRDPAVHGL